MQDAQGEKRRPFPRGFAVVDVETTGLRWRMDRIIEVAVVRMDEAGEVVAEMSTLVSPERSPGATHIHGLSAADLEGAPLFSEVIGEVFRYLERAVVVGHNVKFDLAFLLEETARLGQTLPDMPRICTRELSMRIMRGLGDYRLSSCCRALGIASGHEHRALDDARAAANVMKHLAARSILPSPFAIELAQAEELSWPVLEGETRLLTRSEAKSKRTSEENRLRAIAEGLPEGTSNQDPMGYFALLDEILEDRRLTEEKAEMVRKYCQEKGFLRGDLEKAHLCYSTSAFREALAEETGNGLFTRDADNVARLLGLSDEAIARGLEDARIGSNGGGAGPVLPVPGATRPLRKGTLICFTGEGLMSKAALEERAHGAGLSVKTSVTKKLEVLVVDDPHSMSAKSQKARGLGIRILAVPVFLSLTKGAGGA